MTSTYDRATRVRRIGEERTAAEALPAGTERDVALLRVDTLGYERDCMQVRDSGISEVCSAIDAFVDGVANPKRPFLSWECCDAHRELRVRREALEKRAAALGITLNLDFTQVIED